LVALPKTRQWPKKRDGRGQFGLDSDANSDQEYASEKANPVRTLG
jgi:hypothetical protein